jgi:hypothetical protein
VNIGKAALIGCERATGLPIVPGDHLFGLSDLLLQIRDGLSALFDRARVRGLAHGKFRGLDAPQGVAVRSDLRAMPGNPAVTVRNHLILPGEGLLCQIDF